MHNADRQAADHHGGLHGSARVLVDAGLPYPAVGGVGERPLLATTRSLHNGHGNRVRRAEAEAEAEAGLLDHGVAKDRGELGMSVCRVGVPNHVWMVRGGGATT